MPSLNSRTLLLLLAFAATLPACASYFVRKECEKTDWYEFGKSVAMGGNRMSGNALVRKCEDAEANINYTALDQGFKKGMVDYCLPETVLATGKRGEFFSAEMCDGENTRFLKAQHQKGVIAYCQKANGQSAGAVGKKYNQICPKELEEAFLPEFNKGRKKYLAASVSQSQVEIEDIDREISGLESRKQSLFIQMAPLGNNQVIKRETKYDTVTHTYHEETTVQQDEGAKSRRDQLESEMRGLDYEIQGKRAKQNEIRTRMRELNTELLTLG